MKVNLLFAESPIQLLNAYEAVNYFGLTNYRYMIRLSGSENNDKQLLAIISLLNLENVKILKINASKKTALDVVKILFYRFKYIFLSISIDQVFIGNLESRFFILVLKQFKINKIVLLDDGAKTLSIQNGFDCGYYYDLFTMYDLKPINDQKIYRNKYLVISALLKKKQDKIGTGGILFLGSKLSEVGIIEEEYYLFLIDAIAKHYNGNKIIYIPHRGESQDKLKLISEIPRIKINYIDYPVELYGLYENELPAKVASFYSTALMTIKNIYKLEVECFFFDYSDSIHKEAIDEAYRYYENNMNVIRLNANA